MEGRVASKDLLELEQKKPSFLESNLLVRKKEEDECEATRPKTQKKKKRDELPGKEEAKQHATSAVPASQVLGKVKDFLGVIAEANEKLQLSTKGGSHLEYDIEALSGNETEYIEMDLLLGVADLQTPEAVAVAEAAIGGSHQYLPLSDENSSSDSEEHSDEENDHITADTRLSHKKVPKPDRDDSSSAIQRKKRPKIMVLN